MRKNIITIIAGALALLLSALLLSSCSMSNLGSLEGTYRLPSGKGVVTINIPLNRVPLLRPKLPVAPAIPPYVEEPDASLFPVEK